MTTERKWDVLVIGAGGNQSQAMLQAASRPGPLTGWLCADLAWTPERKKATEDLGATTIELDVFGDRDKLNELVSQARVVANMVGPYFRTIGPVVDACIETKTDYLDICDDADATEFIIGLDEKAKAAGIIALTGMGASPGTTNVLIRTGIEALKSADLVEICWISDSRDSSPATLEHLWHIFKPYRNGRILDEVPNWENLDRKVVKFADAVGEHLTMELAHSELVSVPHYLDVKEITNYGGVAPAEALILTWAMARLGAGNPDLPGQEFDSILKERYKRIVAERQGVPRIRGGLKVDLILGDVGLRFQSDSSETMEESTGTPAAAGIYALLDGAVEGPGVVAPECMRPSVFFNQMSRVSEPAGSMAVYSLRDGEIVERLSLRELIETPATIAEKLGI